MITAAIGQYNAVIERGDPMSNIINRITYWQKRIGNDGSSISALNKCILESEKEMEELFELRNRANEYLGTATERLDYWLQRYEDESEAG